MTPRQLREFLNVEAFAESRGVAFAIHITLHWQCDREFVLPSWSKRLNGPGGLLDKMRRWFKRRRIPFALAWLNEMGREYGAHTHIMAHLPHPKGEAEERVFEALVSELSDWIVGTENLRTEMRDRFGKAWRPVRITGGKIGMRTRRRRAGLCRYWLKTIAPDDVAYTGFGVETRAEFLGIRPKRSSRLPEGVQRFGASRNLSIQARRVGGWRELTAIEELRDRLNPNVGRKRIAL